MSDYLGDLKDRDVDNLQYLLKNKSTYWYRTSQDAFTATGEMMRLAILRCGLDMKAMMEISETPEVAGDIVQEAMEKLGIVIETRPYKNPIDEWRSGVYIYKNKEIMAFIGGIKEGDTGGYSIDTTEKNPEGQ